MLKKEKYCALSLSLALVLLMLSLLPPLPVMALEVKVNTEQKLRNALNTAADGDVINVTGNITLTGGALAVQHSNPLTIMSNNNSVITAGDKFFLILQNDAVVTLAGNIRVESDSKTAAVYVEKARFILSEKAVINSKASNLGIYCDDKGRVNVYGGSLNVSSPDSKDHYAICAKNSSTVYIGGGNIKMAGEGDNVSVGGFDSTISIAAGKISVEGSPAYGIYSEDSSVFVSGGEISAVGKSSAVGIQLFKSKLNMSGGSVSATSDDDGWGIKTENDCELYISSISPQNTNISGKTSGITLVKSSLADLTVSSYLKVTGGVHEHYASMIGNLPKPVCLTAGKSSNLKLKSGQLSLDFIVDAETPSKLDVKGTSVQNAYTLYSNNVGTHFLVMTAKTDGPGNTLKLRIPVVVTAASATVIPFSDVKESDWACDYIMNLYSKGIINGYPDKTFRPNKEISRQHAAKMITLGAGLKYQGKKADFPDVDPNGEMSPYIAALVEKGAIRGYPDGSFRPTLSITRAQIAQIVAKAFDLKMGKLPADFTDLPTGEAGEYIKILASNGIVKGYADGTFKPKGLTTRAQFCKILTIAMAVSGVQKAEFAASYTVSGRDILTPAIESAQALIDVLPDDQDLQTKQYLQARLNVLE